jgi:SPX domain protein involved in polyphosphate accumulation
MRYGKTLERATYLPWKDKYIDYDKLKKLLKEDPSRPGSPSAESAEQDEEWTEDDESNFVEELINVQLEKVHAFQAETLQRLQDETTECEKRLEPLGVKATGEDDTQQKETDASEDERKRTLNDVLQKLDSITKETNELERYSRINYTGFLKACKKHDRKRGQAYRVRPLLQVRLSALPFYKEDYSPMLYRLSAMYSFVRQGLDGKIHHGISFDESHPGADTYVSYKCMFRITSLLILC